MFVKLSVLRKFVFDPKQVHLFQKRFVPGCLRFGTLRFCNLTNFNLSIYSTIISARAGLGISKQLSFNIGSSSIEEERDVILEEVITRYGRTINTVLIAKIK